MGGGAVNPNSLYTTTGLKAQVAKNVGSTDAITLSDAEIWLQRALIRFMELGEWSWQKVYDQEIYTVANSKTVYVPNALKIYSLFMSSPIQRKLVLIEDRKFRQMYPNDTFTGSPYHWRTAGRSKFNPDTLEIGLYPIPDAVYTLKYDGVRSISMPISVSQDIRTVTGMPTNLVDLVIEMATAIGFKGDDDRKASEQMSEALLRLERAYANDQSEIDDRLVAAPFEEGDANSLADPLLPPQYS